MNDKPLDLQTPFERFQNATRQLLQVPKEEVKKELDKQARKRARNMLPKKPTK